MNKSKKSLYIVIAIIVIVVVSTIIAIVVPRLNKSNETTGISANEIKEKLNIEFKEPSDAKGLEYDIENDTIVKVTYTKVASNGKEMHFIMRSSYAIEDDLENLGYDVDFSTEPIYMTTICSDASEVEVESYVALDGTGNMKYMKALWMDNDKYYSMVTDDLVTREDFLQEVNRVIIDNHVSF